MILNAENISKRYFKNNKEIVALDNASLKVGAGEFVMISGRSGSGKSTLLNILAGLIKPSEGKVFFEGEDISLFDDKEISFLRNDKIGYVMQERGLLSNMTVLQNVLFPACLFDERPDSEEKAEALLKKVGLYDRRNDHPENLSGGEIKRVEVARALINDPKILLADEPTGNLDVDNTHELMKMFKDIAASGTSVIMVTHDRECLNYADKLYLMIDGHLSENANSGT